MGVELRIDPDAVDTAAENLKSAAEAIAREWASVDSTTSNDLADITVREFAFRAGLAVATAFWAGRVGGFCERVVDGADYMQTGAAEARAADGYAAGDFVELDDATGPVEYTEDAYYEATGAERAEPVTGGVPSSGEAVPVA
ncbi:hypothetical protein [Glycomyces tenuis]|uniref:hypothetical protein n=1 Tax=Glycomyces tenuis TaxID=58116 RepID=UPI000404D564|nr:hypothetical protein [Glycomyces tenuis]